MIRNIRVKDLRPGMQIIDPGVRWKNRPLLYVADILLTSEAEVQAIAAQGFEEVFVDLSRFLPDEIHIEGYKGTRNPLEPKVELREELPVARKVHHESVLYARRFMDDMRSGKLDVAAAAPVVENIMESIERNAAALLSLSLLQRADTYTHRHCVNVSILSTVFARYLEKDAAKVHEAGFAGLFHDIGKALIPQDILHANRALNAGEFSVIKRHPILGYKQLQGVKDMSSDVLLGALEHHEKHDGTGYPQGLQGEEISRIARMIALADVYDALSAERPYKKAMPPHKSLGIMYKISGTEFHPDYLTDFIRMIGVYPVSSIVELEDGRKGVVVKTNLFAPAKPVVRLVIDPKGRQQKATDVDLAAGEAAPIVGCLPAHALNIDPAQVLSLR